MPFCCNELPVRSRPPFFPMTLVPHGASRSSRRAPAAGWARGAGGRGGAAGRGSTPLFLAQAIGRFVRSRRPGEIASVFLPSVPTLLLLASELEAQRNHVLGQPDREIDELAEAQRRQDEPSEIENSFESLGADAEL